MSRNHQLKKHQLKSFKTIAQAKEQDEALALAKALQRKTEAENKLVELVGYRQQYDNQLKMNYAVEGAFIHQLRENRAFVERLDQAICRQQEQIKGIMQQLDTQIASWRSSHASHQALNSLLERYRQEAVLVADRHNQADTEDTVYGRLARHSH